MHLYFAFSLPSLSEYTVFESKFLPAAETAPMPLIESRILLLRGQKVLLDRDLARLYQVKPIALRQQVRRNPKRFPPDFLFELDEAEIDALLSQNVIPSRRSLGGAKPLAFTEQGIALLLEFGHFKRLRRGSSADNYFAPLMPQRFGAARAIAGAIR